MDVAIGLTIIGILLSWVWYINNRNNNRVIKEISQQIQKSIFESKESTERLIKETIKESRESTERLIKESRESTEKILNEIDKRHTELLGRILEKVSK